MARRKTVADVMWDMLAAAGVRRCYGIVGDALNPVIDALRRNGRVDFVHVRHEEAGVFAAVADACLTRSPVAVCGTAGPGARARVWHSSAESYAPEGVKRGAHDHYRNWPHPPSTWPGQPDTFAGAAPSPRAAFSPAARNNHTRR